MYCCNNRWVFYERVAHFSGLGGWAGRSTIHEQPPDTFGVDGAVYNIAIIVGFSANELHVPVNKGDGEDGARANSHLKHVVIIVGFSTSELHISVEWMGGGDGARCSNIHLKHSG